MSAENPYTAEEVVHLVKALAKAHARIADLEESLASVHETKDRYMAYWLEETEKTKALEKQLKDAEEDRKDLAKYKELEEAVGKCVCIEGEEIKPGDLE